MKTLVFILSVALLTVSPQISTDNVYIYKGKSSKKYHLKKKCRGLSNCSTDISEVSLEAPKKMGRGLCGWED